MGCCFTMGGVSYLNGHLFPLTEQACSVSRQLLIMKGGEYVFINCGETPLYIHSLFLLVVLMYVEIPLGLMVDIQPESRLAFLAGYTILCVVPSK